ncbi:MAG: ATP-binding protein [Burkholderiaceae bacterium]
MKRLAWLKSGLFWRTFFLLAFFITISMSAWVASFRLVERGPRAQQLAAQIVSIVTITRAALTHSAPDLRRELLFELASNEGIRVYPLEASDKVQPLADSTLLPMMQGDIRGRLGSETRFAGKVNDVEGFWISFNIDGDQYWLMLDRGRINRTSGIQWAGWGALVLLLSLAGAVFISRLINQPLARLNAAARSIASGRKPEPLPEKGPTEVRETNRSFNQMAADLDRIESDRAVILAGISHDLRTPITRLQLELELSKLPNEARHGMQSDLTQMDAIIGQFLDYARPAGSGPVREIDLSQLLADCARHAQRSRDLRVAAEIAPGLRLRGDETEWKRVIANLVENARRYGRTPDADAADVLIRCGTTNGSIVLEILDRGPGVPEAETERLLRPFVRMDEARGQANGSGLGLAIVDRIVRRQGGALRIGNREGGGLAVRITLPAASTG